MLWNLEASKHLCWEDFTQLTFEQILKVSMYLPVTGIFLEGKDREGVVKELMRMCWEGKSGEGKKFR